MMACRCVSQMVLAHVKNVKSGWKSMFMVFTTAATDDDLMIVRLAFETIEKIVREHFERITETEVGPLVQQPALSMPCMLSCRLPSDRLPAKSQAVTCIRQLSKYPSAPQPALTGSGRQLLVQVTTFTDCVNCLIAFTNNRHNRTKDGLTVSLNAIAFLRFCAMKLATGAIGDVETFPEGHPQTPTSQVCTCLWTCRLPILALGSQSIFCLSRRACDSLMM